MHEIISIVTPVFGIILLCVQVALGGWVSSSHAALACPDFPLCNGELLPVLDLESALRPWRTPGIGHAGAALDADTLVTIQEGRSLTIPFPPDFTMPPALWAADGRLMMLCNPNALAIADFTGSYQ